MRGNRLASLALLLGGLVLLQISCSLLLQADECEVNDDCAGNLVCGDYGLCVSLLTEQCGEILGEANDPEAILLGALLPLSPPNQESGFYLKRAIELAVGEINDFDGVQGGQGGRKLAVLVCDDHGDVDFALAGARHLVEVAEVPAIIGSAFSFITLPVAREVTIDAGTVLVSPASTADEISSLDDNNLVWRTVPPDSRQADTMAHFATWEVLQSAGVSADGDAGSVQASVTVGLVYPNDAYGQGLKTSFQELLNASVESTLTHVEGLSLGSEGLQLNFASRPYEKEELAAPDLDILVEDIVATQAQVLMVAGYDESADLIEGLVLAWPGALNTTPSYFLSDGMRSDNLKTVLPSNGQGKPRLLFGTNPGGRLTGDAAWEGFEARYLARYPNDTIEEGGSLHNLVEHAYDVTYLLAYALATTSTEFPTGQDVANGMSGLAGDLLGPSITVGPSDLLLAFREVEEGNRLNLRGASGPIAFDPAGDPIAASLIRWDLVYDEEANPPRWDITECGVASSYDINGGRTRNWCNAYCVNTTQCGCLAEDADPDDCDPECVPVHEFGDDDDSASISGDDDTGDDDDSTAIDCSGSANGPGSGDDDDATPGSEGNNFLSFPDRSDCANGIDDDLDQCVDCDDMGCAGYKDCVQGDDDDSAGGHLPSCRPPVMGN